MHQLTVPSMGRFYMALGDAHSALNDRSKAQISYERAIESLTNGKEESLDLYAITQLKISDIHVSLGNFDQAK